MLSREAYLARVAFTLHSEIVGDYYSATTERTQPRSTCRHTVHTTTQYMLPHSSHNHAVHVATQFTQPRSTCCHTVHVITQYSEKKPFTVFVTRKPTRLRLNSARVSQIKQF
jgi:hypothetical protein